jgi:hypothetical protein
MAPFTFGPCPVCAGETKQRFLRPAAGEDFTAVCETCFTVIAYRSDGSVVNRPATDDERAAVPPRVVFSDEQRAEWQASLRQGRAGIRAWFDAGCPGLTPELERAFPPGTFDRLRQFVDPPDEGP